MTITWMSASTSSPSVDFALPTTDGMAMAPGDYRTVMPGHTLNWPPVTADNAYGVVRLVPANRDWNTLVFAMEPDALIDRGPVDGNGLPIEPPGKAAEAQYVADPVSGRWILYSDTTAASPAVETGWA